MSFTLPSATAAMPPGKPSAATAARHNEQEPDAPETFGDVLSRSLAPAGESAGKSSAKPVTPASARRQADDDKTDPQTLLDATVQALVPPPQSEVIPATHSRDALATATAPLTEPEARVAADTEAAAVAADLQPAHPAPPLQAAPALMAASPRDTGQTMPQASVNATRRDASLALVPEAPAVPTRAPDAGTSDPSSQADDRTPQPPALTLGAAKVAAAAVAPADEAAAMTVSAQTPAADTFNPSAALPLGAANAMAPNPASAAVSNATPSAPANPLLAPEVGSGEWGKALGQQVIQMGHAGHQVAELQLNPPGLGPLKVTLSMDDHQIQAMFVSAHASVRAAVEAALPQLRTTLADNGISLGNTSVSADSQQQAAFAQEQSRQPNQRAYPNNPMPSMAASLSPRPLGEPLRQQHGITVDTYA
jgi:flagellar hook-length control protein FliK